MGWCIAHFPRLISTGSGYARSRAQTDCDMLSGSSGRQAGLVGGTKLSVQGVGNIAICHHQVWPRRGLRCEGVNEISRELFYSRTVS